VLEDKTRDHHVLAGVGGRRFRQIAEHDLRISQPGQPFPGVAEQPFVGIDGGQRAGGQGGAQPAGERARATAGVENGVPVPDTQLGQHAELLRPGQCGLRLQPGQLAG